MSISSPQTGGNRRPSTKPAAGAKPGGKSTGAKAAPTAKPADGKPADTEPTEAKSTDDTAAPAGKSSVSKAAAAKVASAKAATAKATAAKATAAKSGGKAITPAKSSPAAKSTSGGRGGNRPPMTPVKVSQGRPWGAIALFSVVGLIAVAIIGFGVYQVNKSDETWKDHANAIPGIVNFSKTDPDLVKANQHQWGPVTYKQAPPVAGPHNFNWQRCMGDVYPAAIANEHAVHALEHGAVWITYRPDLPKDQVEKLASKVRGNDFMLMSPYPGLDKPISLQAWG